MYVFSVLYSNFLPRFAASPSAQGPQADREAREFLRL